MRGRRASLGKPFYLMRRVPGEARGDRLVRDPAVRAKGEALAARLGAELAKLHRLEPPVAGLGVHPGPGRSTGAWPGRGVSPPPRCAAMRAEPVLEWALRLAGAQRARRPSGSASSMPTSAPGTTWSRSGELTAVLDWEFAGVLRPARGSGLDAGPVLALRRATDARPAASARGPRSSAATRPRPGGPFRPRRLPIGRSWRRCAGR